MAPGQLTPEQRKQWDAYYEPRNEKFRQAELQGRDLVRWKYQRYMHDYLGCIKAVDESVGRCSISSIDEKLADNTIVVYTADQGFYLGEHGWFDKRWIFEESLRTPLLVRWPGVTRPEQHQRRAGVEPRFCRDVSGRSRRGGAQPTCRGAACVPILAGQTPADWRQAFYYHYYEYPVPHHVRPHYGVVTDRYKLVHFYAPDVDYWELFDLKNDPHEMQSVYGSAQHAVVQKQLGEEIVRLRKELKVPEHDPPEAYGRRPLTPGQAVPKKRAKK